MSRNDSSRFHHSRPNERIGEGKTKISLPTFSGREDPDGYFNWEQRMNNFFETVNYTEEKKIAIATAQLTNCAMYWWDRKLVDGYRRGRREDTTWQQMKSQMRIRFIPWDYHRDLQKRFRRVSQGYRSVKNYYDEFELLRDRVDCEESVEFLMNHFLDGLQERIARRVERLYYRRFEDLLLLATQVEQQLEKKTTSSRRNKITLEPLKSAEGTKEECAESKQFDQEAVQELPKVIPRSVPATSLCLTPREVVSATQEENTVLLLVHEEEEEKNHPKEGPPNDSQRVLEEFPTVFPTELPSGLPLNREIESQINVLPGAVLPNRPVYRLDDMVDELGGALTFSKVVYDEDINDHHNLVVPSEEIVSFKELLGQEFKGRHEALVVMSAQTANPWSGEGCKNLGVPFDPGKLQSSLSI